MDRLVRRRVCTSGARRRVRGYRWGGVSDEIRLLLIEEVRKRLGPLEAAPGDTEYALLTAVTLRGAAALAGEPNLASALARLEPRLRTGDGAAVKATISLLRRALVRLEEGETATAGSWPVPPPDLEPTVIEAYVRLPYEAELKDRLAGIDQCLAAIDEPLEAARVAFRHVHTLKGASSAVGDQPMSWFCHGLEERLREVSDVPSARAALIELGQYRSVLGGLTEDPLATLRRLRGETEVSARLSTRPPPTSQSDSEAEENTIRVASNAVVEILTSIDALGAMREKLDATLRRVRDLGRRARSKSEPMADEIDLLSGELRAEGDELGSSLLVAKRLVSSLLFTTTGAIFARVSRMVAAESQRLDRDVKTRVIGEDVPIERRLAERLVETCLQLARNAVAHGIEPEEVRSRVGKRPGGTITLGAKRLGRNLEIRIADDGAGVDLAAVRLHAVATGLLTAEDAPIADDSHVLSLLVRRGFSTQRAPDLLAGRGIGLDIALAVIQKLGGALRLSSRSGQGFSVSIEVPLDVTQPRPPRLEPMNEADLADAAAIMVESGSPADTRDPSTRRSAAITRIKEELGRPWARVRVARIEDELMAFLVTWQDAVRPDAIRLGEAVVGIDLARKVATTTKGEIQFERFVSSAPFNRLLEMAHVPHDPSTYSWNKVLVFNLGFDRKGRKDVHWVYYPDRGTCFYRVGFYDNIFDADRLSLYVEIGYAKDAVVDAAAMREQVLVDLKKNGVITDHELVAEHTVVMDPAYVHITQRSLGEHARIKGELLAHGVHPVGRYGGWTYCSIEDNIVEARALAATFTA